MINKRNNVFCKEYWKVENYQKAISDSDVWEFHHRLETHTSDGEKRPIQLTIVELKALDMYYNRPPEELLLLRKSDHLKLHKIGVPRDRDVIERGIVKRIGKKKTEEQRHNISLAVKDLVWWNNGVTETRSKECPEGFVSGRITKNVYKWWHKGNTVVFSKECPEGFLPGRSKVNQSEQVKKKNVRKRNSSITVYKNDEIVGTFPRNKVVNTLNDLFLGINASKKGWEKAYYKDCKNPVFYYKGLKFVKD